MGKQALTNKSLNLKTEHLDNPLSFDFWMRLKVFVHLHLSSIMSEIGILRRILWPPLESMRGGEKLGDWPKVTELVGVALDT